MIEIKPKQLKIVQKPPYLPCIYFQVPLIEALNDFKKLEDKSLDGYVLTLKKQKKKSLNINNYLWVLCGKIAEKMSKEDKKITKEDVYRKAIREVGVWFDGKYDAKDVDDICKTWESNGLGWFAEPILIGAEEAEIRLYKGSSVYNGSEMNRLVDYVVEDAKEQGIETMTPNEILKLKQLWNGGN